MWKDFFYYSIAERRAILFLSVLALLLTGISAGIFLTHSSETLPHTVDTATIDSFLAHIQTRENVYRKHAYNNKQKESIILQTFDPNTADSITLSRLGLSSFSTRNILRYRMKGGVFRTPESLSKIYGITEEQYQNLKPYIIINSRYLRRDSVRKSVRFTTSVSPYKYPKGTTTDLNSADTTELKRIPGIGSKLAQMIVSYRNRLGGYTCIEQIQEIAHVDTTLNKWFKLTDNTVFRKLNINSDGADKLRNHPYMDFHKAKAILEYRRKRGKIKGLSRLAVFKEFTEKDLKRLSPYLSFD